MCTLTDASFSVSRSMAAASCSNSALCSGNTPARAFPAITHAQNSHSRIHLLHSMIFQKHLFFALFNQGFCFSWQVNHERKC